MYIQSHVNRWRNIKHGVIMTKLEKPSGAIVEVNDKSLPYALSLGWKPVKKVSTNGRNSKQSSK